MRPQVRVLVETGRPLASLERLFLQIFGPGQRSPGWFERKIHRESLDAAHTVVALDPGGEPVAFILGGAPPGLPGILRTAGVGVGEHWRRRGLGRAMVQRLKEVAHSGAFQNITTLTEPKQRPFFEGVGFKAQGERITLLGWGEQGADTPLDRGRQPRSEAPVPAPPTGAGEPRVWTTWFPGSWARSPAQDRLSLWITPGSLARLTQEGRALLLHGIELHESNSVLSAESNTNHGDDSPGENPAGRPKIWADACRALSAALPAGRPWLIPGVAPLSPLGRHLLNSSAEPGLERKVAPWTIAQRGLQMCLRSSFRTRM